MLCNFSVLLVVPAASLGTKGCSWQVWGSRRSHGSRELGAVPPRLRARAEWDVWAPHPETHTCTVGPWVTPPVPGARAPLLLQDLLQLLPLGAAVMGQALPATALCCPCPLVSRRKQQSRQTGASAL